MDTSQKYQKMEALVEVGKSLSARIRLSEQEIFELIYQQASEKLGMENLSIALYDEKTDTVSFVLAYSDGRRVNVINEQGWETRKGADGKTEEVIHTKKSLYIATLEEAEKKKFLPKNVPNSWLGVPMTASNKVLGVIATYHYGQDNFYQEDDIKILHTLADMAAIAIKNVRLYDEHTKRSAELFAAYKVSQATYQFEKIEDFYEKIHDIVQELMPPTAENNFYIVLYNSETEKYSLPYFKDEYDDQLPLEKIEEGLAGHVIHTGQPLLITSSEEREQVIEKYKIKPIGRPSKSWLGVPLKTSGKTVGVLVVKSYNDNIRYGNSERNILVFISEQIAMAIERVKAQEKLENRHSQQNALIELAQKLTSSIQLKEEDIFEQIHRNADKIMDTDNMYIALYDAANDYVHFPLAFKNGQTTEIPARKAGGGRTEVIIHTKAPIFIQTKKESDEW